MALEYDDLALDDSETYAVLGGCLSIGNTTVCQERDLFKLEEEGCIPRLLKGGHTECAYLRNNRETVKLIEDGILFLTNFNGTEATGTRDYDLTGSFIVRLDNETVSVAKRNYSSYSKSHLMPLPAVLTHVTATDYQLSLEYVHDVSLKNLQKVSTVSLELLA